MTTALAIAAGALGALARYELGGAVQRAARTAKPWGTAVVNVAGAAGLGVLVGLELEGAVGNDVVRIAGAGFLGAFTTFSTWMVETDALARSRRGVRAVAVNLAGMLTAGFVATAAGLAVGRAFS